MIPGGIRMHAHSIVVFTDGAAKGNPGPGGWGVVIVTPEGEVTELGGRATGTTTNNKMELTGAIKALTALRGVPGALAIYTDSTYVIQGIRAWIHGCPESRTSSRYRSPAHPARRAARSEP